MRAIALTLACALAVSAAAAPTSPPDTPQTRQLKTWLAEVHRSNELSMQLGRLAARRGGSGLVRRYGDRVERDHRECDHRLFKLARRRNLAVDELAPDARQELAIQRLRALNGVDFDRLFAEVMAQEHEDQERRLGQALAAPDVRRLASQLLPLVRQNEELARYLQRRRA